MNMTNIDLDTVEMLSEKLGISSDDVISLAIRELALSVCSDDDTSTIQKQYKANIKEIRSKMFSLYSAVAGGRIEQDKADKELNLYNKLLNNFKMLSKVDGDTNGFIMDYKAKVDILHRELELRIKAKSQHVQEKMAEHSIAMGMIKYGEEL